ncbi:MAG: IS91 family transposase [Verrucomicrobia bacterium]|nr:IS91 family transposase [Verrucomicrobiota bacterium]
MNVPTVPNLGAVLRSVLERGLLKVCAAHRKILGALAACRTPALGGHWYRCTQCGQEHFVPHSCRNRHCPQCQGAAALAWLERQEAVLLPIPYFHLVFTLPHALNPLIRQNRRALLNLLFAAASQTLLKFGRNELQAQIGLTAVLHTWGQTLVDHYHLHCIVTGGGLALEGSGWVKSSGHYLFSVRALSEVFSGKFRAGVRALYEQGALEFHGQLAALGTPEAFARFLGELRPQKWVVYAKRPLAGPKQVLAYLSRYTHRVAISNARLRAAADQTVTFAYKDYADGHRRKTMSLGIEEFARRFCLHLLPERFVKIRHYGLLGNRDRQARIERARQALGVTEQPAAPATEAVAVLGEEAPRLRCPHCGAWALVWIAEQPPLRGPRPTVEIRDSS